MYLDAPDHLRLFVALSVPEAVQNGIEKIQQEFRNVLVTKSARWTRREQFHLTLRFLGNVESSRTVALIEALQCACHSFPPLQLRAAGIGFFPDIRFPRVLWLGISAQDQLLPALWKSIQSAAQPFTAEEPENTFVGHATLARLNRLQRSEIEQIARVAKQCETQVAGEWTATQLELMRSELSPQGARHTVLAELPFGGR